MERVKTRKCDLYLPLRLCDHSDC